MSWLNNMLMIVQVLSALGVIVLVLMQHGKGADMGAAFGSGSSGSLFGASGSANFLSRTTGALATVFLRVHARAGLAGQPAARGPDQRHAGRFAAGRARAAGRRAAGRGRCGFHKRRFRAARAGRRRAEVIGK